MHGQRGGGRLVFGAKKCSILIIPLMFSSPRNAHVTVEEPQLKIMNFLNHKL